MMDVGDGIPLRDAIEGIQLTVNDAGTGRLVLRKEDGTDVVIDGVYLDCTMIMGGEDENE